MQTYTLPPLSAKALLYEGITLTAPSTPTTPSLFKPLRDFLSARVCAWQRHGKRWDGGYIFEGRDSRWLPEETRGSVNNHYVAGNILRALPNMSESSCVSYCSA